MSFIIDRTPPRPRRVDPETGETLVTTHWHRHSDRRSEAILSADGVKTFEVTFKINPGEGRQELKPGRMVLMHATEYDAQGQPFSVLGWDPDVDRIVEYFETLHSPAEHIKVLDRRRLYRPIHPRAAGRSGVDPRFALRLGLVGLILGAGWVLANGFVARGE